VPQPTPARPDEFAPEPAGRSFDQTPCPLALTLAQRMRDARDELTGRWLERIAARVALEPNRVFPTDELLDHVPLLIAGVADYVEHPTYAVQADSAVVAKAMELGALRHAQGFDAYEVLKEYEILGGILFAFLASVVDTIDRTARARSCSCARTACSRAWRSSSRPRPCSTCSA
jgi:hypothetical protein